MLVYSTRGEARHDGRLREALRDFQVDEILALGELSPTREPGLVPVYKVTKAGVDTPHVAREIASIIKSEVNFAGLKDKNATVTQYVSARSARAAAPAHLQGARFEAGLLGFSRPITRSMLRGNRFRILVQTQQDIGAEIDICFEACRQRRVANFFGYQRFGARGGSVNRRVGKAIVEKDFTRAVMLVLGEPRGEGGEEEGGNGGRRGGGGGGGEAGGVEEARRLCREGRFQESLRLFSRSQDIERMVAGHLARKPDDHFGALRRIPIAIRRLLVNSYQSYLFNLTLSRIIRDGIDISTAQSRDNWARIGEDGLTVGRVHGVKEEVPKVKGGDFEAVAVPLIQVVGYAYRDYHSRFDAALAAVLKEEGISPASFYVKEAEELSSEGGFRPAPLLCRDLSSKRCERGFEVEFSLGKGEYATVLLRELLKPQAPHASGF
jgi:tRNA pseudouridine13 synthase